MEINLNTISKAIHEGNLRQGFYDPPPSLDRQILLVITELAESIEADRKNKKCSLSSTALLTLLRYEDDKYFKSQFQNEVKDTYEDEIADTMIRLFDLCGYLNIDIDKHISAKVRYNSLREYKHGKRY
jgi:NTP pyrophosphatase (non-canonical NTP hydrolase)